MERTSTIATYIRRFRGPPTSREERERAREEREKDFWWVDKASQNEKPQRSEVHELQQSRDVDALSNDVYYDEDLDSMHSQMSRSTHDQAMSMDELATASPPSSPLAVPPPPPTPPPHLDTINEASEENVPPRRSPDLDESTLDVIAGLPSPAHSSIESLLHSDARQMTSMSTHRSFDEPLNQEKAPSLSINSSIESSWYASRPEDVLVEDPEVTIQRLRSRLGLPSLWTEDTLNSHLIDSPFSPSIEPLSFAPPTQHFFYGGDVMSVSPSSFDLTIERRLSAFQLDVPSVAVSPTSAFPNDYVNLGEAHESVAKSTEEDLFECQPENLESSKTKRVSVENESAIELPHEDSNDVDAFNPSNENQQTDTATTGESPPEEESRQVSRPESTADIPMEIADTSNEKKEEVSTEYKKSIGIAFRNRNHLPLPPIHPEVKDKESPDQVTSIFDEMEAIDAPAEIYQVYDAGQTSSDDLLAKAPDSNGPLKDIAKVTSSSEAEDIAVGDIVDNLVTSVVLSWADGAKTPVINSEPKTEERGDSNEPEVRDKQVDKTKLLDQQPSVALASEDLAQDTLLEEEDFSYLDDDIVRMLVQRILLCEEALAILNARKVLGH
ncbi:hypothetical protein AC1031_007451 [Aphanomyces cochlioides]|nr:hypothetical protein AC1031_007451 [Aphanomyces cochlioides]